MKTIYLQVLGEGWVSFQYTNISELEEEFAQRGIEVGDYCELGNYFKLGNGCEPRRRLQPRRRLRTRQRLQPRRRLQST